MRSEDILENPNGQELVDAGNMTRFYNYLVDSIFSVLILLILGAVANQFGMVEISLDDEYFLEVFYIVTYVLIASVFESITGKTVGKFLTRCHVVTDMGEKPRPLNIVGRNLARLIPFDAVSFIFGRGWHDSISKTRVVLD
jgi:hypothetical protein